MAKSKAQRMREYRARKKEELGDEWLRRENDRVKGYFVPAAELSQVKRSHKRELNKKHCATYRKKQKSQKGSINQYEVEPQASTSTCDDNGVSSTTGNISLVVQLPFQTPSESRQSRGRKRITNALAIQYRKQETLRRENSLLKRKLNTTRRSLNRLKQRNLKVKEAEHGTPKSKTNTLMKQAGINPTDAPAIRQKLLFAECISQEVKDACTQNKRELVKCVVSGKVIKKYRMRKEVENQMQLSRRRLNSASKSLKRIKKTWNNLLTQQITKDIRSFLERDDNSRQLPGKADGIKVGKEKVQKRVLNDYMYNLHLKFLSESTYKVSLATFCRKKPLSISHVNFASRSVCLCQRHQNFALKLRCLKNYKISSITSPDKFMDTFNTHESLETILKGIQSDTFRFQEWKRKKMSDGKEKMRVVDIELAKDEFIDTMLKAYDDFAHHKQRVAEQYHAVKDMKAKLPEGHVLIQMDFSENYCCQNLEEVQSAYWNATAVTLHPTVMYKKVGDKLEHTSIVFVSEVLQHNASMVITIIDKVIGFAKEFVDGLTSIHFWTDSPSSQYRNKTIFDYISTLKANQGITASWQYFESGHGKGPCDGIGGTTKRNADNAVKQGKVILQDADDFYKWASETDSQIRYEKITKDEFEHNKARIDQDIKTLKPLKGTMKIHSVVTVEPGILRTRETTCACDDCFGDGGFNIQTNCMWDTQQLLKKKARTREDLHGVRKSDEKLRLNVSNKDNDQSQHEDINADEQMPTSESKDQDSVSRICDNDEQLNGYDNTSVIDDISVGASKHDVKCNADDFVVIVYDDKRYIGQVVDIDNEDGEYEVSCMEECGKMAGRYKWPKTDDRIWLSKDKIVRVINDPVPTGSSKRMFCVDKDVVEFMTE